MSLPNSSNEGPLFRKPRADLYTALLVIALLAMILACVFAYLEVKDYGSPPYQGGPSVYYMAPGATSQVAVWENEGLRTKDEGPKADRQELRADG